MKLKKVMKLLSFLHYMVVKFYNNPIRKKNLNNKTNRNMIIYYHNLFIIKVY